MLFTLGLALAISLVSQKGDRPVAAPTPPPLANIRVNEPRPGDNPAETSMAANPTNPKHFVVAWIELAPNPELNRGVIGYASSKDSGATWQTAFLDTSEFQLAFDPSLVV